MHPEHTHIHSPKLPYIENCIFIYGARESAGMCAIRLGSNDGIWEIFSE